MIVATRLRSPAPRGKDHDNQILMRPERFPEEKAVWLRLRRVDWGLAKARGSGT